jgi:putative DNA primase/helicase
MAEPASGFDEAMRGLLAAAHKPVVEIRGGDIVEVIDRAEKNLIAHDPGVFQFGDFVVWVGPTEIKISGERKVESLRAIPLTVLNMVERFTATSQFQKFRRGGNEPAAIDFPDRYAKAYIERVGRWRLPVLTSIATAPVLCSDGRIIDKPGYDRDTGVYYDPLCCLFEPVPEHPTRDDALAALELLKGLYRTIKLVSNTDRAVALSMILTLLSRRCYEHAPAHLVTAPVAGAGKSKIIDMAAVIATGAEAEVCEFMANKDEFAKSLASVLMAAPPIVSFDNIDKKVHFGGSLIEKALTQKTVLLRVLQYSRMARCRTDAVTFFGNGNNLTIAGDTTRRAVLATIDPQHEAPETIQYDIEDPLITVKRDRARYVTAGLTILKAYIEAGRPDPVRPIGSFEEWSALVPSALVWLGEANPIATMLDLRKADPERSALLTLLTEWTASFGSREVTTAELLAQAATEQGAALQAALLAIVEPGKNGLTSRAVSRVLGQNRDRVVEGWRLTSATGHGGYLKWRVIGSNEPSSAK